LTVQIALDAMGGDHGPAVTIPAALYALKKHPALSLILVGEENCILEALKTESAEFGERLRVEHAPEVVEMHELPSSALRNKRRSSMRIATELVKEGRAHACVSAGNTGALMGIARYVLKMLPGIDRPAICAPMPGIEGHTHLLDLGANVNPSSDQLFQYAVMGSELTSAVDSNPKPSVGLLNVGEEEIKGNEIVKQAAVLLSNSHLNFAGFVEGSDIFTGKVDVIVCDGFVGNIALKASEGAAKLITHHVQSEFRNTLYGKAAAVVSLPVLKRIKGKIDPRHYNGASLLGLRGIVVKSHGGADTVSFANAIKEAVLEVEKNVPERINTRLEELLTDRVAI